MATAPFTVRLAPWTAWITSAVAVALNHQGQGDAIYFDCRLGNPVNGLIYAAVALVLTVGGAAVSWRARVGPPPPEPRTREFIAMSGALISGIYGVAIVFQLLATQIIPVCAR